MDPGRSTLLAAGLALAALLVLSVVAASGPAAGWETDVVDFSTRTPDALGLPVRGVMQLGTRPAVLVVAALAYLLTRQRAAVLAVVAAGLLAMLTNPLLKELITRDRPSGVTVRDPSDGYGFPSGHTSLAFALAAVVAAYLPPGWVRAVPLLLAAIVGFGRMHVGVHFPLDVLGGAAWGLALGWVVISLPPLRPTPGQTPVSKPHVTDGTDSGRT